MSNQGEQPSDRTSQFRTERSEDHPGRRSSLLSAGESVPGEAVNLVRMPSNAHDSDAIAVLTRAGELAGYLPRELAAEFAGLVDEGIIQLAARLTAPGDPEFDAARVPSNPTMYLWIFLNQDRLNEFLAQVQSPRDQQDRAVG